MSNTYTIFAGLEWTIESRAAKEMMLKHRGKEWPVMAAKATSSKGVFWIIHYEFRMWREGHRPFERDLFIALDADQKPLMAAACLSDLLLCMATNRSPDELPDEAITASDYVDTAKPQRTQFVRIGHERQFPAIQSQQPRASAQREGMWQRMAKLLGRPVRPPPVGILFNAQKKSRFGVDSSSFYEKSKTQKNTR